MPWPLSAVHSALFGKAITNGRGHKGLSPNVGVPEMGGFILVSSKPAAERLPSTKATHVNPNRGTPKMLAVLLVPLDKGIFKTQTWAHAMHVVAR